MATRDREGGSRLCRKVQKHQRSPSQRKYVGLSRTIVWQVKAPPSDTWNLQHSWGDSGTEEGVHWTRHCRRAGPTLGNKCQLPTSSQQEGGTQAGTAKESDDERRLFITPLSRAAPLTSPARANSYAYDLKVSEELMRNNTRTTRKRSKRRGLSQVGEKRLRKTPLNYISQK